MSEKVREISGKTKIWPRSWTLIEMTCHDEKIFRLVLQEMKKEFCCFDRLIFTLGRKKKKERKLAEEEEKKYVLKNGEALTP